MDTETIAMTLIAHSGDARTLAFQALQAAKKHDFEEADRLMGESRKASAEAHHGQTDLSDRRSERREDRYERASDPFPGSPDDQYAGSGADRRDD